MKKMVTFVLTLLMLSTISTAVFAAPPPTVQDITFSSIPEGFTVVEGLKLELGAAWTSTRDVTRESWSVEGMVKQGPTTPSGTLSGDSVFIFDATTLEPGTYTVTYKIWHHVQTDRTYEESVEVTVVEASPKYIQPMAAPNVAGIILEYNDVDPRYGQGSSGGNYISDVADLMGNMPGDIKNTDFMNEAKEEWSEEVGMNISRAAYRQAVYEYLSSRIEGLMLPSDEYFAEWAE